MKHQKNPVHSIENVKPRKLNNYSYMVDAQGPMKVPLKIFASDVLLDKMMEDQCILQGMNVAALPGVKGFSVMMPDAHQGYGFSIGGVAAIDVEEGCISPGGIGFDINCGVRLLSTNLQKDEVYPRITELLDRLFVNVPPGVGAKSRFRVDDDQLTEVLKTGASWCVEQGHGTPDDLENCESNGKLDTADPTLVSTRARKRGRGQIGTLGAGNHFLEIQYVEKIFDKEAASAFGLSEGQVVVMIHCGSRGLGHQVCSDYLRQMEDAYPDIIEALPEKDLVYAPAGSEIAENYFKAMCAAANFAWANRHMIGVQTRKSFKEVFTDEADVKTVYDVAHNIAKIEEHAFGDETFRAYVHRKGATRAFGPNHPEVPKGYQHVGQPIFIPGSMGTASWVLVGQEKSMEESFGSTAHGAGRLMSRKKANDTWTGEQIKEQLAQEKIHVKAASWRGVSEEAPGAYKDVDEVVKVSHEAGIGKLVARLKPIGVVKG